MRACRLSSLSAVKTKCMMSWPRETVTSQRLIRTPSAIQVSKTRQGMISIRGRLTDEAWTLTKIKQLRNDPSCWEISTIYKSLSKTQPSIQLISSTYRTSWVSTLRTCRRRARHLTSRAHWLRWWTVPSWIVRHAISRTTYPLTTITRRKLLDQTMWCRSRIEPLSLSWSQTCSWMVRLRKGCKMRV